MRMVRACVVYGTGLRHDGCLLFLLFSLLRLIHLAFQERRMRFQLPRRIVLHRLARLHGADRADKQIRLRWL